MTLRRSPTASKARGSPTSRPTGVTSEMASGALPLLMGVGPKNTHRALPSGQNATSPASSTFFPFSSLFFTGTSK